MRGGAGDPRLRPDDRTAARRGARGRGDAGAREMRRWRGRFGRGGRYQPHRGAVDREATGLVREPPLQPGLPAQDDLIAVERDERAGEPGRAVQHAEPWVASTGGNDAASALGRLERAGEDAVAGSAERRAWRSTVRGRERSRRHGYCVRR